MGPWSPEGCKSGPSAGNGLKCRVWHISEFLSLCFQMVRWVWTLCHLPTPWAPSRRLPLWDPCPHTLYKWAPLRLDSSSFSVFASWILFSMQILPIILVASICIHAPLGAHLFSVQMVSKHWQLLFAFRLSDTHSHAHLRHILTKALNTLSYK